MNAEKALQEFLLIFPEFHKDYVDHMELNDELLSHIFYGETINEVLPGMLYEKEDNEERLKSLFRFFEKLASEGDIYIQEVLQMTILERLGDDPEALRYAYKFMGPKTRKFSDQIEEFWGRL